MNSTNTSQHRFGAPDALFDQIERELHALTFAPLDGQDAAPRQCVDEFANEFLGRFHLPPPGAAPAPRRRWL